MKRLQGKLISLILGNASSKQRPFAAPVTLYRSCGNVLAPITMALW
jgi:hypothetical protein